MYNDKRVQKPLRPDFNYPYFMQSEYPESIRVNCLVVFLPIGNLFLLIATMNIEEHEEVVLENTNMGSTNVVVKEEHVYINARTFFQNWVNGPDRKYFHLHAGSDMALERVRGIELGFGKRYGVDRLVIDSVEKSKE